MTLVPRQMCTVTRKMSDENSELDEIDFNSELESAETISNSSLSPSRHHDAHISNFDFSAPVNIAQNLFRREMGFGCLKPIKQTFLKSYHLSNIFSHQVLLSHIFLGMTKCGRFLITYTMLTDQDDDEWYATVYKYRLHWWNFKPGGQARKIAEVSLFGNHKIVAPLQIYVCQWPQDYEKILVYGLIRECSSIDASGPSNNQHAFVTVTALPSLNNCQECRIVASSYLLDDIAASWDTCLRFSCLKHGYTVHTSFDVVVPYPEFLPKISLKCNDYAVFNANNFLYALKITLGNCDKKPKEESEDVPYRISLFERCEDGMQMSDENTPSCSVPQNNVTANQKKALKLKEQIIKDFSEEITLNPVCLSKKSTEPQCGGAAVEGLENVPQESPCRFLAVADNKFYEGKVVSNYITSPPLPTRVNLTKTNTDRATEKESESEYPEEKHMKNEKFEADHKSENKDGNNKKNECLHNDCFRCPMSPSHVKRSRGSIEKGRNVEVYKTDSNCSKKYYKSFFTRHKVQKNNMNFGMFIRNMSLSKTILKSPKSMSDSDIHPVLESGRHRLRGSKENVDSPYEFVDDAQHEVEKLSLFRKKRLADKKYEFQDFDSENIVPFSIVRQENTLRSPKKFPEAELEEDDRLPLNIELRLGGENMGSSDKNEMILRSPSPRYPLDLSISVPSPRSPLILEILSSPTQYEGVLRPFNRNTNGNCLLSPMAKYLASPPANAQKPTSKTSAKDCWKAKVCDEVKLSKQHSQGATTKTSTTLDTRLILENGILINDISEWYFKEDVDDREADIYANLFRNLNKFHGEAVRFERRFVEVDDELVSVITDIEDDDMSAVTGYHTALNLDVHGAGYAQLQMISNSKAEKLAAPCVVVDQQSLDIEGICHSVATTLCQVSNKTFTFCNDYDIEILDVCPRSGDVLVLLMMRIEGAEGIRDEVSKLEQYEASVTLVWNLHCGTYKVCMVVPPQKVNWAWNSKAIWNPAKEASKRFRMQLPADVTFCDPAVRVCGNISTLRGISLARIEDLQNGIQFVL